MCTAAASNSFGYLLTGAAAVVVVLVVVVAVVAVAVSTRHK
jgi:hypothetical protein